MTHIQETYYDWVDPIPYLFIFVCELMGAGDLVNDLCNSNHFTVMVDDGHAENAVGTIASPLVHLWIEARILSIKFHKKRGLVRNTTNW